MANLTTLAVHDKMLEILDSANGTLDVGVLRTHFPGVSPRVFGLKLSQARKEWFKATGQLLKPVPGKPGVLRVASQNDVVEKVTNTWRHNVVKAARKHYDGLVAVQGRDDLDSDTRRRLSNEEMIASRDMNMVERTYLRQQRAKPWKK